MQKRTKSRKSQTSQNQQRNANEESLRNNFIFPNEYTTPVFFINQNYCLVNAFEPSYMCNSLGFYI